MAVEEFRQDLSDLSPKSIEQRISVYTYELNLLIRLARTHGIRVSVDTVERAKYTEILVRTDDGG